MGRLSFLKEYGGVLLGTAVIAASFNLFLVPNQIAAGGLSGLGVILYHLFRVPVGLTIFLLNLPLFITAARLFGFGFIARGIFGTAALSVLVEILAFLPAITEDLLLASLYGGILMGVGIAIVFRFQGSTGGTVLAAQVLNRIFGFSSGQSLLLVDFLVIALAGAAFNLELAMYALISLFVSSNVIDFVQEGIGHRKAALIISEKTGQIAERILYDLDRGATILAGKGAYSGREREMVMTIVAQSEVPRLKDIVRSVDSRAFVVLGNVHDVLGEGFSALDKQ
ncbi:MAG: YitT family protein [Bacillota bacterium]|jgi:uncharacterized membrane-anchored protein YitT (DUF2179 family)|nr:YitT family protein [Bacillota bacterium]HHU30939.1 YitT family protein [Bacillota bacterium]